MHGDRDGGFLNRWAAHAVEIDGHFHLKIRSGYARLDDLGGGGDFFRATDQMDVLYEVERRAPIVPDALFGRVAVRPRKRSHSFDSDEKPTMLNAVWGGEPSVRAVNATEISSGIIFRTKMSSGKPLPI